MLSFFLTRVSVSRERGFSLLHCLALVAWVLLWAVQQSDRIWVLKPGVLAMTTAQVGGILCLQGLFFLLLLTACGHGFRESDGALRLQRVGLALMVLSFEALVGLECFTPLMDPQLSALRASQVVGLTFRGIPFIGVAAAWLGLAYAALFHFHLERTLGGVSESVAHDDEVGASAAVVNPKPSLWRVLVLCSALAVLFLYESALLRLFGGDGFRF